MELSVLFELFDPERRCNPEMPWLLNGAPVLGAMKPAKGSFGR
jgi:hypothetical protein